MSFARNPKCLPVEAVNAPAAIHNLPHLGAAYLAVDLPNREIQARGANDQGGMFASTSVKMVPASASATAIWASLKMRYQ